ncbi:MAG TPA: PadR family transcriptional regulator [Vicinamibacterales bacterium]|nr:PadR family transcriptional regulator [Vicinamibacterales bacterium]
MPPSPSALPQGTLDLLILRTLAHGPRHGYGLARWIEEATDDVLRIEEGSLYPALYRMERRGWIAARWRESDLGKDIKVYALTDRGRAALRERTAGWAQMTTAVAKVLRGR